VVHRGLVQTVTSALRVSGRGEAAHALQFTLHGGEICAQAVLKLFQPPEMAL
jgi:hypothetical protein